MYSAIERDQSVWNQMVFYLFERRYGWSDGLGKWFSKQQYFVYFNTPIASAEHSRDTSSSHTRKQICEALDLLIADLKQLPINDEALEALAQAAPASALPLVRNQLYLHALDWLKRRGIPPRPAAACGASGGGPAGPISPAAAEQRGGLGPAAFAAVRRLVILGLTDVWSATRKACAGRLAAVALLLDGPQLDSLAAGLLDRYQQAAGCRRIPGQPAAAADPAPVCSDLAGGVAGHGLADPGRGLGLAHGRRAPLA